MSQVTTGLRSILSNPFMYELFQRLMGARTNRARFFRRFIEPYSRQRVLDIGCGPAAILEYLDGSEYYGFDISAAYIDKARSLYGDRGRFFNRPFSEEDLETLPEFDLVLLSGVLHHVSDEVGTGLLKLIHGALKPGGRLVTTDGCLVEGQNPAARFLILHDRGQNIKTEQGYLDLAHTVFDDVSSTITHIAWVPYTLCYMECTR